MDKKEKILATLFILAIIALSTLNYEERINELENQRAFLEDENYDLKNKVEKYFSALYEANENIDWANSMIEDTKSYAGSSYQEMKQAIDDLAKIDKVDDTEGQNQEQTENDNLLDSVKCENNPEKNYWDFTSLSKNESELIELGKSNQNFYILCGPEGSGGFQEVYVFRNNKLIFKMDGIYQGIIFFDNKNNLNISKGVFEKEWPNCCPKSYILTRYKYDSKLNTMQIINTAIYLTKEVEKLENEAMDSNNKKVNCKSAGGKWAVHPLFNIGICNMPAIDKGKICQDQKDCDGACLAESENSQFDKCSDWTIILGCRYYMKNGKAVSECRD